MTLTARKFFALKPEDFDAAVEASFYGKLKMRNGTFKLTRVSRFAEIETAFGDIFAQRAASIRKVLDVAVSTGITTVELSRFLRGKGAEAEIVATDLFISAYVTSPAKGVYVLADPTGWPLQYEIFGRAVRPWIRRLDYVTLMFVPRLLAREGLRAAAKSDIDSGRAMPVNLVSTLMQARPDIAVVEDNILQPSPRFVGQFDFIRAANILNRSYFSDSDLLRAIANIRSYLRGPGSLLLVTRTNSTLANAGTLFECDAGRRFRPLARLGSGSEIENLVLKSA